MYSSLFGGSVHVPSRLCRASAHRYGDRPVFGVRRCEIRLVPPFRRYNERRYRRVVSVLVKSLKQFVERRGDEFGAIATHQPRKRLYKLYVETCICPALRLIILIGLKVCVGSYS